MSKIDTSTAAVTALLDGVTPGPWYPSLGKLMRVQVSRHEPVVICGVHKASAKAGGSAEAVTRFIAAARQLVPALSVALTEAQAGYTEALALMATAMQEREAMRAERDALRSEVQKTHRDWQGEIEGIRKGWAETTAERDAALAEVALLRDALDRIRELNMTGADENGHRWAHSDLIEQEIVFSASARAVLQETNHE